MNDLFIGLMSGTSLDGVDGVLADFGPEARPLRVLAHVAQPFDADFREQLLQLNAPGDNELHRAALAANRLARAYAAVVQALLQHTGLTASAVQAIGAHGQTVRHRPLEFDGYGYTVQLNNPALLAELTGIAVVSDFRSRDIAAGGQGAPLVPAFHRAVFGEPEGETAVLNLGGIANLTVLGANGTTLGFDCGPGNALMDLWCARHLGQPYDHGGAWAAQGQVQSALLAALLTEPWLQAAPPKSTGRDLFNTPWLERYLVGHPASAVDVQATLCEFTAEACARHLQAQAPQTQALLVCGGGAFNTHLMRRLAALLPGVTVLDSGRRGLPPLQVEAAAFAWLARQRLLGAPGNLPAVTGARAGRVLGGLHPA